MSWQSDGKAELSEALTVTHDGVLVEVLAHVSGMGSYVRERAVELVREMLDSSRVLVIEQERELFEAGLDLYRRRRDKTYSLTDAISLTICERMGITRVLSHDHHFEQEGLELLL